MNVHARTGRGTRPLLLAVLAALSLVAAACSSSGGGGGSTEANTGGGGSSAAAPESSAAGGGGGSSAAPGALKCGSGNGQKATGTPIKIGAIVTKQPGTDFTDITNMAKAYFQCVNDNGGVNGHPIQYIVETEQTNPGQDAALAKKLIGSEHVLAMVGNTSIIDCAVNHKYYEAQGIFVIGAGIAQECWSTPNNATVNMGPRFSSDGAVQYVIKNGAKKVVFDQSNVPGTGYNAAGLQAIAKSEKVPLVSLKEDVPIQDANSVALKEVQAAGDGGAVVLNFTPPEALKILQAAQRQGLQNRVQWACSTPCNTDFLADALGSAWDGKLAVNAELNLYSTDGPDMTQYRAVRGKYAPKLAFGSFSQMGFLDAKIAVSALETVSGAYTVKSVNDAFVAVKNFKTDMLCKPWYYGQAPLHITNNTDYTVTPKNGKMVLKQGCTPISAVDPFIKKVRDIEKANPDLTGGK
jgi:branched-chain amino acid transport system substrate-binding protein